MQQGHNCNGFECFFLAPAVRCNCRLGMMAGCYRTWTRLLIRHGAPKAQEAVGARGLSISFYVYHIGCRSEYILCELDLPWSLVSCVCVFTFYFFKDQI